MLTVTKARKPAIVQARKARTRNPFYVYRVGVTGRLLVDVVPTYVDAQRLMSRHPGTPMFAEQSNR